jgi:ATP-dependent DNA helicase RecG
VDTHEFEGTLWEQLNGAIERFRRILQVRFEVKVSNLSLEGLARTDIWEYPLEALREAVINALIHRDYTVTTDIQIRLYDNELSIWNPGGLPPELIPIAQPKFTKTSMPDNPLVYYYQRKRLAGFPAKRNGRRSVRPPGTPSPSGANARRPHEP